MAAPELKDTFDGHEFERAIVAEAMRNPDFRAALKEDPRGTIEKLLGRTLMIPDDVRLKVIEESEKELFIVLPAPVVVEECGKGPAAEQRPVIQGQCSTFSYSCDKPSGSCTFGCVAATGCTTAADVKHGGLAQGLVQDWKGRVWQGTADAPVPPDDMPMACKQPC